MATSQGTEIRLEVVGDRDGGRSLESGYHREIQPMLCYTTKGWEQRHGGMRSGASKYHSLVHGQGRARWASPKGPGSPGPD